MPVKPQLPFQIPTDDGENNAVCLVELHVSLLSLLALTL